MSDLEKAQEVLRAWRRDAMVRRVETRIDEVGEFTVVLLWSESYGYWKQSRFTSPNPLTAALEATRQTPWPQSVPEGSE